MTTKILKLNSENLAENVVSITNAAKVIKNGGLVAFPTETVYGLGADLYNINAIDKIYEVKGRPANNPLIAHICDLSQLQDIVKYVPPVAKRLIDAFWSGPLTMIFKKSDSVPIQATGGLDTIAVRFPQLMTARELVRLAGVPIAAPSANISGRPSPTEAEHVIQDFDGKIDMILDGGSVCLGLESTIIDVSGHKPYDEYSANESLTNKDIKYEETKIEVLRPGSITCEMLLAVALCDVESAYEDHEASPRAPGMRYKHYAPSAKAYLVDAGSFELSDIVNKVKRLADKAYDTNKQACIGILASEQTKELYDSNKYTVLSVGDRQKPEAIAANLFGVLRRFNEYNLTEIFCEAFPEDGVGVAIMNRLKRACGGNIL